MFELTRAFFIAVKAHRNQRDKSGRAYIFHPLHVSRACKSRDEKILALLHDVLEDSDYKIEDINFLTNPQKEALNLLTHKESDPYFVYINKIKNNDLAKRVKIADLSHNMDLKRLKVITEKDIERLYKYQKAIKILKE